MCAVESSEYFVSINDLSKRLSVPAHTLRYWEKQFPTAVRPTTGAGGRRYYRAETVEKLIVIKDLLYTHGMTIAGVKKMLREGNLPVAATDVLPDAVQVSVPAAVVDQPVVVAPSVDLSAVDAAIDLLESARNLLQ